MLGISNIVDQSPSLKPDPGQYSSVDAAVRAVAPLANALSAKTGTESGGYIVPKGNGFTYTHPEKLADPCKNAVEFPDNSVASYHTHPATCPNGVPSEASFYDKMLVAFDPKLRPLYYITPQGQIFEYTQAQGIRPLQ